MQQGEDWHRAQTGSRGESSGKADILFLIAWFPPANVIDTQVVEQLYLPAVAAAGFQLHLAVGRNIGEGMGVREIPVSRTTEAFSCLGYFLICFPPRWPLSLWRHCGT